jgi:hypothetical protein
VLDLGFPLCESLSAQGVDQEVSSEVFKQVGLEGPQAENILKLDKDPQMRV